MARMLFVMNFNIVDIYIKHLKFKLCNELFLHWFSFMAAESIGHLIFLVNLTLYYLSWSLTNIFMLKIINLRA